MEKTLTRSKTTYPFSFPSWTILTVATVALLLSPSHAASVDVSVKAEWPSTASSLLLETSEYLQEEDTTGTLFWSYWDQYLGIPRTTDIVSVSNNQLPNPSTLLDPTLVTTPLTLAKPLLSSLTYNVLRVALGARSYSPTIESHRQLALSSPSFSTCGNDNRHTWLDIILYDSTYTKPTVWASICTTDTTNHKRGNVTEILSALDHYNTLTTNTQRTQQQTVLTEQYNVRIVMDTLINPSSLSMIENSLQIWDWDHRFPAMNPTLQLASERTPLIFWYANMGQPALVQSVYHQLRQLAWKGSVRSIFRHWFPVTTSSSSSSSTANDTQGEEDITWVSGYGVGLDVKSTEYKVIDDRNITATSPTDTFTTPERMEESIRQKLNAFLSQDKTLLPLLGHDPVASLLSPSGPLTSVWSRNVSTSSPSFSSFSYVNWDSLMKDKDTKDVQTLTKLKKKMEQWYGMKENVNNSAIFSLPPSLRPPPLLHDKKLNTWETGDLGLQAVTYVMDAVHRMQNGETGPEADPLVALVTVASNFPSMAPYLSRLPVNNRMREEVEMNNQYMQAGTSFLTVNNINIDPLSPLFNLFSLINVLRSEAHVISQLDTLPLSTNDKRRVQNLAVQGGSNPGGSEDASSSSSVIRVDVLVDDDMYYYPPSPDDVTDPSIHFSQTTVGKRYTKAEGNHTVIHWFNDIEKDMMYSSWPNELRTLLQPSWQLHQLRRNLYNAFVIADLSSSGGMRALQMMLQFVQMRVPIRLGWIFLPGSNVQEAKENIHHGGATAKRTIDILEFATGLDYALLHAHAMIVYGPEVAKTVVRQWLAVWYHQIETRMQDTGGNGGDMQSVDAYLTIDNLLEAYAVAVQSVTGSWRSTAYRNEGMEALEDEGGSGRHVLLYIVQFIQRTGVPTPCSVLNGRPTPGLNLQQDLMSNLNTEMQLFQMAVQQQMLDDSVKPSVYHALLGHATALSVLHTRTMRKKEQANPSSSSSTVNKTYALPGAGLIVPRWHPSIFVEGSDQVFLPLSAPEAVPLIDTTPYLHAPQTVDDVKPVSITLFDDLNTEHGLFTAASLLTYVRQAPDTPGTTAAPCVLTDGLHATDCPTAPSNLRADIARAVRVGLVHVPTLLLPSDTYATSSVHLPSTARYRGTHASRSAFTVGDAISLAAKLISGKRPELLQVRADEQGPLFAGLIDIARADLRTRNGTQDRSTLGCTGCHSDAIKGFLYRLAQWLGSGSATVPVKARTAEKLLVLLDVMNVYLHGEQEITQISADQLTSLVSLYRTISSSADIARSLVPSAVPEARTITTDEGGSSMRIRAIAANGRILGVLSPSSTEEDNGDQHCIRGTFTQPTGDAKTVVGSCITPDDVAVLVIHERLHRGSAAATLLQDVTFQNIDADSLTAEWMSSVVMTAASAVGASLSVQAGNSGGRASGRVSLRTDRLQSEYTSFTSVSARTRTTDCRTAGNDNDGSAPNTCDSSVGLFVIAIIDPTSEDAQRYAPLLLLLRDRLGATVQVYLNPGRGFANLPVKSFFRYVLPPEIGLPEDLVDSSSASASSSTGTTTSIDDPLSSLWHPRASFAWLPSSLILTLKLYVPEPWNTQASYAVHDTDNLRLSSSITESVPIEYTIKQILVAGQCLDFTNGHSFTYPNGLQLLLSGRTITDGRQTSVTVSDTLVMQNLGYWQLKSAPGVWNVALAPGRATELYDIIVPSAPASNTSSGSGSVVSASASTGSLFNSRHAQSLFQSSQYARVPSLSVVIRDFTGPITQLYVKKKLGKENQNLLSSLGKDNGNTDDTKDTLNENTNDGILSSIASSLFGSSGEGSTGTGSSTEIHSDGRPIVHVFSLASGHVYERFLKIMLVAATKRSPSAHLHFWLVENFLSPAFKDFVPYLAKKYNFDVSFVTYKWPNWLRQQSEKQRIIWGYKILFLDVLFPLNVTKIIYIDADQVVRADLMELWNHDLEGAPYAYTPFCTSRAETLGYQFWRDGYWKDHLQGKPYHISALYVVDLVQFRKSAAGDQLRAIYDQLSRDPNSLSNLDQDLPNYAQNVIPIHSLPQEWLWCESWCSDSSKAQAKTIDLCNNPRYKEPKLDMARRVINGNLFPETWDELDQMVQVTETEYTNKVPVVPVALPTPYPVDTTVNKKTTSKKKSGGSKKASSEL